MTDVPASLRMRGVTGWSSGLSGMVDDAGESCGRHWLATITTRRPKKPPKVGEERNRHAQRYLAGAGRS